MNKILEQHGRESEFFWKGTATSQDNLKFPVDDFGRSHKTSRPEVSLTSITGPTFIVRASGLTTKHEPSSDTARDYDRLCSFDASCVCKLF
jgi:hypothetical protein